MTKILFLASAHKSKDDRIFYHQAKALVKEGFNVCIFSFLEDANATVNDIFICSEKIINLKKSQQITFVESVLKSQSPDVVICDSPLTVLATAKYRFKHKCKIIYDVTEWYPSKKNLSNIRNNNFILKFFKFISLTFANQIAGICCNMLMFGEHYKSFAFFALFWKRKKTISYYPDLLYIEAKPPRNIKKEVSLFFSGKLNIDKGVDSVIEVAKLVAQQNSETTVRLNIIGFYANKDDKLLTENLLQNLPSNLLVDLKPLLDFRDFCSTITENDIFLDLRVVDFENTHCLPIKIFYYMACARPVVYSDLKAIQKEITEENIGIFINPKNTSEIANKISQYIENQSLYETHCHNCLELSKNKYNWGKIEKKFVDAVKIFIKP